ncbi:phosphopyruvate hydratase [Candidimonas nitroreducens]|uniref:Enolase n=1 Tax=Candidimonas nitroreducens TaxID=683354 RepID=A0A225M1A4_9BURK|nr:enolase [Candidimonas nitroreducens]OWT53983.1 enolase [Candidimonas nitroreducens]
MEDKIVSVRAQQIIDTKCRPTVEVEIRTESGATGLAAASTGTSVGMREAYVLRDQDPTTYGGLSVHKAVANVADIIAPEIVGLDIFDQRTIDATMIALDGTPNKSRLGGNAIQAVSAAAFRAAADSRQVPLYSYISGGNLQTIPVPCFNVVNGGRYDHLTQAFNEFLIVPHGTDSVNFAIEMAVTVFQKLNDVITKYLGYKPPIASSYGYVAPSDDPEIILLLMQEAIDACNFTGRISFALDCASSEMYDEATNTYELKGKRVTASQLIDYAKSLTEKFNIVFIEDLLDENDWDGFVHARQDIDRTLILGDDLTATNMTLLKKAYELRAIGGFILKPNQVGTITEALDAYHFARQHGMLAIPSGRAGGVVGDIVRDMSVGLQVPMQKNGAPRSGERIEALNLLMRASAHSPGCSLYDIAPLLRF